MRAGVRASELLVKAHLALWLVNRNAQDVRVSVGGAEPSPGAVRNALERERLVHTPIRWQRASWTGIYTRLTDGVQVTVTSEPGPDAEAGLPDGQRFMAECKGEPTLKGLKAGYDLTAFYTAIGQLLMTVGGQKSPPERLAVVVPNTPRILGFAGAAVRNPLLQRTGLTVLLVDHLGTVTEVGKDDAGGHR